MPIRLPERSAGSIATTDWPDCGEQHGRDATMLSAILGNSALAGLTAWRDVPAMAFELAWLPRAMKRQLGRFGRLRGPGADWHGTSPILPSLAAQSTGLADTTLERRPQPCHAGTHATVQRRLFGGRAVDQLSVVMGLASTGRAAYPMARRGLGFLLDTVRGDASWPIDTNLSVWNTALSINALASASGDVGALGCLDWLLACQRSEGRPPSRPGPADGAATTAAGSMPDVDGTTTALLALSVLLKSGAESPSAADRDRGRRGRPLAARMQNDDGGWPTFCRGSRSDLLDGSGADLTAHALRALRTWQYSIADRCDRRVDSPRHGLPGGAAAVRRKLAAAVVRQPEFPQRGEPDLRHVAGAPGLSRSRSNRQRLADCGRRGLEWGWRRP